MRTWNYKFFYNTFNIHCGYKVYPTFMFPNPSPPADAVKQIPRFPKYHRQSPWWNSRIQNQTKPTNQPSLPRKSSVWRQEGKLGKSKLAYVKNFVQFWAISKKNFPSQKLMYKISFSRTSPKAEMVLLGRHKKFKTTSQFSGFRLSNINLRSPTATHQPTTSLSNPSVRRIEQPLSRDGHPSKVLWPPYPLH